MLESEMYAELRRVAERQLRNERMGHTLQATALVHEAWMRLADQNNSEGLEHRQFCIAAAGMMRRILIDHARARNSQKRGGGRLQVSLNERVSPGGESEVDLLNLDDALKRLSQMNERHAQIVELRYFAGLSISETAQALDVSDFTVKADWRCARAWLLSELSQD